MNRGLLNGLAQLPTSIQGCDVFSGYGPPPLGLGSPGDAYIQRDALFASLAWWTNVRGVWSTAGIPAVNAQTGTTYTTIVRDAQNWVTLNNASAVTVSMPTNANLGYPIGTAIYFAQIGTGQVTIQAANSGTTTIESTGGTSTAPKLRARYSSAAALKLATDTWLVIGDIA